jgi:hypothetical protein
VTPSRIAAFLDPDWTRFGASSNKDSALHLEQALVVDVEAERLGGRIKVGAIDEERNLVGGRCHSVPMADRERASEKETRTLLDRPISTILK